MTPKFMVDNPQNWVSFCPATSSLGAYVNVIRERPQRRKMQWHRYGSMRYKCEKGDWATESRRMLQKHEEKEHRLQCGHCAVPFAEFGVFRAHLRDAHAAAPPRDNLCEFCPYATAFPANLRKHVRARHLKEARFACHLCDYTAVWSSMLKAHKIAAHCS